MKATAFRKRRRESVVKITDIKGMNQLLFLRLKEGLNLTWVAGNCRRESCYQKVHVHVINDFLPVPAKVWACIHDIPDFLYYSKSSVNVSQA